MAMAALGLFVFELRTTPFQSMQRDLQWRYAFNSRIGKRPSVQYLGQSNDPMTLSGSLYPELTGGRLSLLMLEMMADNGKAWSLIGGNGVIYGMFVIEGITETKSFFFEDGAARKIEFSLKLKRVDESLSAMFGDLNEQLNSITDSVTNTGKQIADGIGGLFS